MVMTLDENQLHDLIHSCYEAAFEPTRWQAIRKRLRAALGAEEYRKLVHHLPDGDPGPAGSDGGTDPAPPTVRRDGCAADSTGGGLLARLLPHIDRSRQIHLRLTTANRRTARLAAALDRLPLAVLLVATDDRVVYANAAGARLLRAGDGLALRDGRVVAAGRPETDRLHRLIAAAAGARHIASSGRMIALPRPAPGQPQVVLVAWPVWRGSADLSRDARDDVARAPPDLAVYGSTVMRHRSALTRP
jgi:PAS domain-containing protein